MVTGYYFLVEVYLQHHRAVDISDVIDRRFCYIFFVNKVWNFQDTP